MLERMFRQTRTKNNDTAMDLNNVVPDQEMKSNDTMTDPTIAKVLTEKTQGHETRQQLFVDLSSHFGRPVITFFTSFHHPVAMEDQDVEILEDLLQTLDLSEGVAVMISSPGGSGLAAERMINVLRSYSGTGEYWAIVPGKAKSAATMVCLGASQIFMSPVAELGPVDPQIIFQGRVVPVHHIINSYEELFGGANMTQGRIEPYLQQLANYDKSMISQLEAEQDLAADIVVRCLQDGMLSGKTEDQIKEDIVVFLHPQHTKAHARPIYHKEAQSCGLNVKVLDTSSGHWNKIYELYVRSRHLLTDIATKVIETDKGSYFVQVPLA